MLSTSFPSLTRNVSPNFSLVDNITTASALAFLVTVCTVPVVQDFPSRKTVYNYELSQSSFGSQIFAKVKNWSSQALIACNLAEIVHTPVLSAGMLDGGAMKRALSTIAGLGYLADGWAGFDSVRPSDAAISEALAFAEMLLSNQEIQEPIISPATDGEVNFFWENEHITVDLGFYGDGSYSYYAKTEDGQEFFEDHFRVDSVLSSEVLEHLIKA